jgi:hypothetical protein
MDLHQIATYAGHASLQTTLLFNQSTTKCNEGVQKATSF